MLVITGYLMMLVVGVLLGVIGGGGSILTVPILVYLFGQTPTYATGYSLLIVGFTSLVGSLTYARQGMIDYKTGAVFAIPSFVGVFVARKYLVPALPDSILILNSFVLSKDALIMTVFAIVMLLAASAMLRQDKPSHVRKRDLKSSSGALRLPLIAAEGLLVGSVTGFVGAGGGFLIIPALVILAGLSMKVAVGTSLMIIAAKSLFGYLGELGHGYEIDFSFMIGLIIISIVGILLGSILSKKIQAESLKKGFGWFVLIMGFFIIGKQFF